MGRLALKAALQRFHSGYIPKPLLQSRIFLKKNATSRSTNKGT
jgi:hypothetical protein